MEFGYIRYTKAELVFEFPDWPFYGGRGVTARQRNPTAPYGPKGSFVPILTLACIHTLRKLPIVGF